MHDSNRRPPFAHRPWITGGYYDKYLSKAVLHMDAYVTHVERGDASFKVLAIDYTLGGRLTRRVACDVFLIKPDGLTPLWSGTQYLDPLRSVMWGHDGVPWGPLHVRVLDLKGSAEDAGRAHDRWSRVLLQCHYVPVRDAAHEPPNAYS